MKTYSNTREYLTGDTIVQYNCHPKHELNPYYYKRGLLTPLKNILWGTSNGTLVETVTTVEDTPREVFRDDKGRFYTFLLEEIPERKITQKEEDEMEERAQRLEREYENRLFQELFED